MFQQAKGTFGAIRSLSNHLSWNNLLGLTIAIIIVIYVYLKWTYGYWKRHGVPHVPATSLIFGNVEQFFFSRGENKNFYQEIYNSLKGEPFVGYYEFQNPVLLIRDLDVARGILSQNFKNFNNQRFSISSRIDPLMAMNPFSRTYHNQWKESRSSLSAALALGKLRSCPQVFSKPYCDLSKFIDRNPGDLEAMELAKKVTCDVVASLGWGVEGNACSEIESPIFETFKKMQLESYGFDILVLNKFIAKLLGSRVFSKNQTEFFLDLTRKCIASMNGNKVGPPCLLQYLLMSMSKTDGFDPKNDEQLIKEITANLCVFFLDGFSTTSAVLCYALYELMMNKDVQSKLRNEIKGLDNNLSVENVEKLEYLDMVISEIYRSRTVFHYLGRTCTEACTLGTVKLSPGTDIIIPSSAIHMDPRYYPNPEQFNPENFSKEKRRERHPYAFLPFGNGPRTCLGINFANLHLKMMISNLVNDYEIGPPTDHNYGPIPWQKSQAFLQFTDQKLHIKLNKLH